MEMVAVNKGALTLMEATTVAVIHSTESIICTIAKVSICWHILFHYCV